MRDFLLVVTVGALSTAACFFRPGDSYACTNDLDCGPLGPTYTCPAVEDGQLRRCVDTGFIGAAVGGSSGGVGSPANSTTGGAGNNNGSGNGNGASSSDDASSSSGSGYVRPAIHDCTDNCTGCVKPQKIEARNDFVCALMSDTTLRCWGGNGEGRLGRSTANDTEQATPSPVLDRDGGTLSNVVDFSVGEQHACALVDGGTPYCWGQTYLGKLGPLENPKVEKRANKVAIAGVRDLAAGYNHTCFMRANETRCFGSDTYQEIGPSSPDGGGVVDESFTRIVTGGTTTYGLLSNRTIKGWGNNGYNQLAVDSAALETSTNPIPVGGLDTVSAVAAGDYNGCVLREGQALCWGYEEDVNGWDWQDHDAWDPNPVLSAAGGPLEDVVELAVGGVHACAIVSDGTVWCWGTNANNERGEYWNGAIPYLAMQSNTLGNLTHVALGGHFSCVTNTCGQVYCWGEGSYNQLGNPELTTSESPVRVEFP